MKQTFDILVVGGGVVGLTAALAMSQRQYSVALIDAGALQADTSQRDLRVYAINQASRELFENLGVWEQITKTRFSPYQHMHVWDAVNDAAIDFNSRLVACSQLGAIIEESVIKQALLEKIAQQENIHLFANQTVDQLHRNDESVIVSSGNQVWQGRLLMVSDGADSPTREKLDVSLTRWSYHHQAIVAMVEVEKAHQRTAWQVFNSDGPLAFLPLNEPNLCSIVWSTTPERAKDLMSQSDEAFNEQLTDAFHQKLGKAKLASQRFQFPLTMRHAKQYSGDNWMLLGDAAHTIHPLAGLGLNVGLADLASWLNELSQSKQKYQFARALAAYQRQRKSEVWKVILLMDGLKSLFSNDLAPVKLIRGLGLRCINQLTVVKQMLIQQAMGK